MENEIKRGDIYYVVKGDNCGCENEGGRPAVIVSNDMCNKYSQVLNVVYLTTRIKKPLPTHVDIESTKYHSTALCEQVTSVSRERLRDMCGRCTELELKGIDNAIRIALGISQVKVDDPKDNLIQTAKLESERDTYKAICERLISKIGGI